jgi:ABC-2 type transport system permease protein
MRKVWVIASREYVATVQTKAFVIGLLIVPILMGGSIVLQKLLGGIRDTADLHFEVIDRADDPQLTGALQQAVHIYNETQTRDSKTDKQTQPKLAVNVVKPDSQADEATDKLRETLSDRVRMGELFGFLEIGPDVPRPPPTDPEEKKTFHGLRYQTNRPTHLAFPNLAEAAITAALQERRGREAGLDPARLREIMQPVKLESKGLSKRNKQTNKLEDDSESGRFASLIVPGAMMVLMYMIVLMGATPLMQGVVEEKMNRIAEVLLGSVRPFQLMLGKLIGMTGVSLTMTAVYLAGLYWAAQHYGFVEYVGPQLVAWFLFFQALASLMYGSLFIAVGAACTDLKETQTLMWPVLLLAMIPMFVLGNVLEEPNGPVATGLSFFPFATPSLMVARLGVPPGVPLWQPLAGAAITILATFLCVYAAGRIFRIGLLLQGKGADFGQLLRWVVRG